MSERAIILFAAALKNWLDRQNYENRTQERVSVLADLGLTIDPDDLTELKP